MDCDLGIGVCVWDNLGIFDSGCSSGNEAPMKKIGDLSVWFLVGVVAGYLLVEVIKVAAR